MGNVRRRGGDGDLRPPAARRLSGARRSARRAAPRRRGPRGHRIVHVCAEGTGGHIARRPDAANARRHHGRMGRSRRHDVAGTRRSRASHERRRCLAARSLRSHHRTRAAAARRRDQTPRRFGRGAQGQHGDWGSRLDLGPRGSHRAGGPVRHPEWSSGPGKRRGSAQRYSSRGTAVGGREFPARRRGDSRVRDRSVVGGPRRDVHHRDAGLCQQISRWLRGPFCGRPLGESRSRDDDLEPEEHVWFGAPGHRGRDPRARTPVPRDSYRRPRQDGHRHPPQYRHRDRRGRQRLRWCACAQVRRALRLGRIRIRADDAAEVSGRGRTRFAAAPRRGERGDALLLEPRVRVADAMSDAQQRYRRLGKYELHQLLGEGAMGIVWKAYDTVLRRYVALKLLSSSFRKTRDMQERFLREARAAGAIQHANVGTPTYMAPEQITNGAITPATDVFSVGCMLYELLTYQRPFEAESVHGVLYQVLTTEPRPLRTVAPSIPAALERVVAKAMNKVPHERYESAGQMMSMLQQIRAALSGADEEATQPLGRWTPLPRPVLKLITHASMRARLAVLGALAAVVLLLLYAPGQSAEDQSGSAVVNPPPAAPTGIAPPPPIPAGTPVSMAVSSRRDSAVAARERAFTAGAQKNSVPALIMAQSVFEAADQALQRGDQSLALRGYVEAAQQYDRARDEARAMDREAQHMIERVTPVVQAIPTGRVASNAGVLLARAESLLREQDFTLAKVAAQGAEQIGIDAGIAPPSTQPPDPRGAVDVLLSDLASALASERIANLRVLYPGLTDPERRSWQKFFRDWNKITAKFTLEDFKVQGTTATANVRATFEYVPAAGGAPRVDRRGFAMRFERKEVGWRLAAVTALK